MSENLEESLDFLKGVLVGIAIGKELLDKLTDIEDIKKAIDLAMDDFAGKVANKQFSNSRSDFEHLLKINGFEYLKDI